MPFVAADWSITRSNGNIRYIGDAHAGASPSYCTGIEFHRALMDFADDAADAGDDELAIIDNVPSQRGGVDTNITLLNGYNIDDASSEHLYDTSITQDGGNTIYDGIQVFGNATSIQIIQDGARLTNDFWNEPKMITATEDAASSTTHRFLVKVRTGGADIDGRRLLGTQRVYGTVYTEFNIGGGTNRGNNVLALTANSNLNNQTAEGTVATWTDIVNDNEGYSAIDADGNAANEFYYSDWELAARSKNDFYERAQWLQREGSVSTLYGLNGDIFRGITHEIDVDTPTGTLVEPEQVTWSGGVGQLLATDSTTAATKIWIQLLSGVAPTDGQVITGAGAGTVTVNVTVTSRLLSLPFVGASTGTAIIGAFGLGIGADDLAVADLVTALDNVARNPPNNVQFSVTGLDITVGEEDTVLVGPESGGVLDVGQDTVNGTLNGASVTSIVVNSAIPLDTPASGTLRVQNDEGRYVRISYTSYSGSTYTIPAYDFSGSGDNDSVTTGNNIFISYIDKVATSATESVTVVYQSNRNLVVRVRNGNTGTPAVNPIVPFEAVAILGSAGGSQTASRVLDT